MTERAPWLQRVLDIVWRLGARAGTLAVVLAAFALGMLLANGGGPPAHDHDAAAPAAEEEAEQWYTCSMHPDVRMPNPDDLCPICNMSLIPVGDLDDDDDADPDLPRLRVSPRAAALMQVETMPAIRRHAEKDLRLFGRVDYDETRTHEISLLTAGRVERLFLNYVNMPVPGGARVAEVYSPEVLAAAEELLVAQRTDDRRAGGTMTQSARRKLELLGVPSPQVDAILESGEIPRTFTLYTPRSGVLTELKGYEGNWLNQGDTIATISDTSRLWVHLEAYEEDLQWIRYGQEIEFTTAAHPGEVFEGRVSYIEPVVTAGTRTVRVRATVDNPDGRLKPDMFVRGIVHSALATGGRVINPALEGKWISPVHPEIVKDGPGVCDICGTELVQAPDLGYATAGLDDADHPLLIPASAPLHTGKRAVVYVKIPGEDRPTFEGRTVVLGPRAGGYYEVKEGVEEGDLVVTHGNFRIDSELQIRGRPSMMARPVEEEEEEPAIVLEVTEEVDPAVSDHIGAVVEAYVETATALSLDDFNGALETLDGVHAALDAVDADPLEGDAAAAWEQAESELRRALDAMTEAADLDGARVHFEPLSDWLAAVVDAFGAGAAEPVYLIHCPMAFDNRGADWLHLTEEVANPYFGSEMYRCGDVVRRLGDEEPAPPPDDLDVPGEFADQVAALWDAYLMTSRALANDDPDEAAANAGAIVDAVADVDADLLDEQGQEVWGAEHGALYEAAEAMADRADIEAMREAFEPLSTAMRRILLAFHGGAIGPVYVVHCPMAFDDEGADWLDDRDEVHNPYFGDMMYSCGEVTDTLLEAPGDAVDAEIPAGAGEALAPAWEAYRTASQALADDDESGARGAGDALASALDAIDPPELPEDAAADWTAGLGAMTEAAEAFREAGGMDGLREAFEPLSTAAATLLGQFHGGELGPIYVIHCPMAFDDEGADWLDNRDEVHNPYFGETMYSCGYVSETLSAG